MYPIFHSLLSDKTGGEIFTLFCFWHYFFIGLTFVTAAVVLWLFRNKNYDSRKKAYRLFINLAFVLYILDFFCMPLSQCEINIEKLPFHVCTTMCVMCFLSQYVPCLKKFHTSFAMLGFLSNFVYLFCPAGMVWKEIHPLSYRVVQTLLFHGAMAVYGFLVLVYERDKIDIKKCYRDFLVVVGMTLWALLGNYIYNADMEGYSHFFNWFFVVQDPFSIFPKAVGPFLMPFLNTFLFCLAEALIHWVIWFSKRKRSACAEAVS
jgi:hypothetical protein